MDYNDEVKSSCAGVFSKILTTQDIILDNIKIIQEDQKETNKLISEHTMSIKYLEKSVDRMSNIEHNTNNREEDSSMVSMTSLQKKTLKDTPTIVWIAGGFLTVLSIFSAIKDKIMAVFS